ncbi:MAG: YjbQ family protein [Acidobacteriia bacterium]|nr:YjbQ family protein [Terriglobia bacterium]
MESRLPLRLPPQPAWAVDHECLTLKTLEPQQFIDITDRVLSCVRASGISDGTVTVQSMHTTAAILVNEHEPLLLDDLGRVLAGWAPADAPYSHDDFERRTANMTPGERPNGHAHARAMALQVSATLAVIDAEVRTGQWQRIFLVELDGPRSREVAVTTAGLLGTEPRERLAVASPFPQLVEDSTCG